VRIFPPTLTLAFGGFRGWLTPDSSPGTGSLFLVEPQNGDDPPRWLLLNIRISSFKMVNGRTASSGSRPACAHLLECIWSSGGVGNQHAPWDHIVAESFTFCELASAYFDKSSLL
jgi:hypothetical protein